MNAGGFQFRLDVVERLRRQELQREQRAMAASVRSLLEARRLEEVIDGRLAENQQRYRAMQTDAKLNVAEIRTEQVHLFWLRRVREQTRDEAARRVEHVDTQREKLVRASRRVKVLEKLRERQWHRYLEAQRRLERKQEDEFAALTSLMPAGLVAQDRCP
jgi:flagellar export protein FliJ